MGIISKRLTAVAEMITQDNIVADIGCDHAHLPIYLINKRKSPRVIACDVNTGPLEIARKNVALYGYSDKIDIRLGNGLEKISPGEVDTVVIAGMGGPLIIKIITAGSEVLKATKELIIEPQSEISMVRHFLEDNGYNIVAENMILEEGKFYPIIKVINGNMHLGDEVYYKYGKLLITNKNNTLKQLLVNTKNHTEELLLHIDKNGIGDNSKKRIKELTDELELCNRALMLMD